MSLVSRIEMTGRISISEFESVNLNTEIEKITN